MKSESFNELRKHLARIKPSVQRFCDEHGFKEASISSIGRYPRIRVVRQHGAVQQWLDLSMGLDENGRRFTEFFPDIPYELGAGAFVDLDDGSEFGVRYSVAWTEYEGRSFSEVEKSLYEDLMIALAKVMSLSEDEILRDGQLIKLGYQ